MRFADQTLVYQAVNGEACELRFAYVLGSGESQTVTGHSVYLPVPRVEIARLQGIRLPWTDRLHGMLRSAGWRRSPSSTAWHPIDKKRSLPIGCAEEWLGTLMSAT